MPSGEIVIVLDCGATNVRVIAINRKGDILASESYTNDTKANPFYPSYHIWDIYEIWNKMCLASRKVLGQINKLIWLFEQKPELVEKSKIFLFMPSIYLSFLTDEMVNDMTMAETSMVTSLASRGYSKNIINRIGFPVEKLADPVEAGGKILGQKMDSGVPIKVTDRKETTVLGASLFVQAACGDAGSPEEARSAIDYKT